MASVLLSILIFLRVDLVEACRAAVKKISAHVRMIFFMMAEKWIDYLRKNMQNPFHDAKRQLSQRSGDGFLGDRV